MTSLLIRLFIRKREDTASVQGRSRYGLLGSVTGMACNLLLFLMKLLAGVFSGSVSILADAFNNLSDLGSSLITMIGFKMSAKPADREHPFGHGRVEYITGFVVAIAILYVGIELARGSIDKILHPEAVTFHVLTAVILGASILVKLWMYFFYRKLGQIIQSASLRASAMDSFSDMASTSAVLLAFVISYFFPINLDPYMGLLVACFILYSGVGVVRDTLNPLLGQPPAPELIQAISEHVMSYDGIVGIHDLVVHDYGPGRRFVSVHAEVPAGVDIQTSHDIIDRCERDAEGILGLEMVVHMDPIVTDNETLDRAHAEVMDTVLSIDPCLSIHDFRMVEGDTHTNLIFDLVLPPGFALSDEQCLERVRQGMSEIDPGYCCVIHIDKNYALGSECGENRAKRKRGRKQRSAPPQEEVCAEAEREDQTPGDLRPEG